MCDCASLATVRRHKRIYVAKHQLTLPFPEPSTSKIKCIGNYKTTLLEQQPAKFPHAWWRLADANGSDWRVQYQREWVAKRKAAGLPHLIANPSVPKKITSQRVGTSAGNAVPGQLCDPRQMTA